MGFVDSRGVTLGEGELYDESGGIARVGESEVLSRRQRSRNATLRELSVVLEYLARRHSR